MTVMYGPLGPSDGATSGHDRAWAVGTESRMVTIHMNRNVALLAVALGYTF